MYSEEFLLMYSEEFSLMYSEEFSVHPHLYQVADCVHFIMDAPFISAFLFYTNS